MEKAPELPPVQFGLTPPEVFGAACQVAVKKSKQPVFATLVLGFSAGALIGVGALLMTAVGASSPGLLADDVGLDAFLKGAVGLPAGLTLVVLTGAELFTSNIFIMLSGVLQGTVKVDKLLRNWVLSYFANLVGSVFLAGIAYCANTLVAPPSLKAAEAIALMKVSLPFHVAFAKGVLCNWLVCLAVWGALASPSISGKVLAIFWPIATFVALGFEHCVANMFLIPQGALAGANVNLLQFLGNIVPVTLGNVVGAAVFVAGIQYIAFGNLNLPGKIEGASSDEEDNCAPEDFPTPDKNEHRTRGMMLPQSEVDGPRVSRVEADRQQREPFQQPRPNPYLHAMMPEREPFQQPRPNPFLHGMMPEQREPLQSAQINGRAFQLAQRLPY